MVRLVLAAVFGLAPLGSSAFGAPAASVPAVEKAVAHSLGEPGPVRFRQMQTHGDIVCGELAGRGGGFTPFYAHPRGHDWEVHVATDAQGLQGGLVCFDHEAQGGAKSPACAGYDFQFYFAWDHFCR